MSAPCSPRPLVGLAAAALVVGLVGAPLMAYADPTPAPTPTVSAAATPTPTPSSQSPSASPSETSGSPDPTATPSDTASPSGSPSPTDESNPSLDPSTESRTGGGDLRAVPSPTESAEPAPRLAAQAVAGPSITLAKSANPTRVSKVGQVVT